MIYICFTIDKGYVEYCATTIVSILMNSSSNFCFYIIHSDLDDGDKEKFQSIKQIKDFEINFVKIDIDDFSKCYIPEQSHFKPANYFRLKLASILSDIDKVLYLDSDMIVMRDIKYLWDISIEEFYVAGCKSMVYKRNCIRLGLKEDSPYINSGLLYLNLNKIRKDEIEKLFFNCIEDNPTIMQNVDQDVINLVLLEIENGIKQIEQNWNTEVRTDTPFTEDYEEIVKNPYIIHYLTKEKPWQKESRQLYKNEYNKYNKLFKKVSGRNVLHRINFFK